MEEKKDIFLETQQNIEEQLDHYEALLKKKEPFSEQQISYLLQLALDLDDEESATRAYILCSDFQSQVAFDSVKALDYAKLALQQCEDLPDFYWRIKALNTTASCYHAMRDYPSELNLLNQALQLLQSPRCGSLDYYPLHNLTNFSVGVMYIQMGLYGTSQPYMETALKFAEAMGNREVLFKNRLTLANLLLYKKEYDAALENYLDLLEERKGQEEIEQTAILNNYIGMIYSEKEDYETAEKYLIEAVRIRKKFGNELRLNYSYFSLCKLFYKTGRTEEGDRYFDIIMKVADKYPQTYDKQMRNDVLYELYAAKGDYKASYEHFKHLDVSFVSNNILEQTIRSIFENERNKQLSAQQDADQLRRINDEIHQEASQLQSLNKDLKNYARTASHDLREPLRMVSTYMAILEAKLKDKLTEEERQFMHFAVDGSKRMDEMITRILNSAKGNQHVMKPVDLNKIVDQLRINLSKLIAEKNADVTYENLPMIIADDIQMLQIFQNLVTNAIKYNKSKNPAVHITSETKGKFVQITVTDNGVGIPEGAREQVFEMFSRVENASGADGTGIGLSTVKSIIDKMKGKIWIEGNEPHGSVFQILLPVRS